MYSQYDEERYLLKTFQREKVGRFLDVGAFDGETFSNTRKLWEMGWDGVMVEPSPTAFIELHKRYAGDTRLKLVMAAVIPSHESHGKLIEFHNSPDAVSTAVESNYLKWKGAAQFDKGTFYVPTTTIPELKFQFGAFDFVNIDAEGMSPEIFLNLPLSEWRPKAICVEHEERNVELANYIQPYGYGISYLNGTNMIFVRF